MVKVTIDKLMPILHGLPRLQDPLATIDFITSVKTIMFACGYDAEEIPPPVLRLIIVTKCMPTKDDKRSMHEMFARLAPRLLMDETIEVTFEVFERDLKETAFTDVARSHMTTRVIEICSSSVPLSSAVARELCLLMRNIRALKLQEPGVLIAMLQQLANTASYNEIAMRWDCDSTRQDPEAKLRKRLEQLVKAAIDRANAGRSTSPNSTD